MKKGKRKEKPALGGLFSGGRQGRLSPREEANTIGENLSFAAAEAYKLLRTNIMFALPDEKKCRIIGITSSCSGEGKSTTSLNLANMLAETGAWVLLIEADMRLPTMCRRLNINAAPGLSNLLAGLIAPGEAIQGSGLHKQMRVITSGDIPPNPSELLGSRQMQDVLKDYANDFDFIVLDLPPVTAVSDALVISRLADGMVMVVRQDYASRRMLGEAMRQLQYVQAKVLGFVMTHAHTGSGGRYRSKKYGKYGYGYGYGYGEKKEKTQE